MKSELPVFKCQLFLCHAAELLLCCLKWVAYYKLFTSQNRKTFEAFKCYSKSGQHCIMLTSVMLCSRWEGKRKGKKTQCKLFTEKVGTLAPTVSFFTQALHSPRRERSSCSSSYQRQCLSQNMENRPVPAPAIPEGCKRGAICGITSVVPAVCGVECLSA